MKMNLIKKLIYFGCIGIKLQAIEHGETFLLKRKDAEKYLSLATSTQGGSSTSGVNIYISPLIEEPVPKATSRWTIRKVGYGNPEVGTKISKGDKFLIENTATGFYLQNDNVICSFKNSTGVVGTTSPNWEEPNSMFIWTSDIDNEITLINNITFKIVGKMPSQASLQIYQIEDNISFLNQALNCSVLFSGIKEVSRQIVKDSLGKPQSMLFGISPTGSLYRLDSGAPVCVQNRYPLYCLNATLFNGASVPRLDFLDVDKSGNIIVGDSQCFASSLTPNKIFAPLWQKVSDLLYINGTPQKIYLDSDAEIIRSVETKKPWFFLKALNPIKYAKYDPTAPSGTLKAYNHNESTTILWPGQDLAEAAYPKAFIDGDKAIFKMRFCKVGNKRVVARPTFSDNNSELLVVDNIETSDAVFKFKVSDGAGTPMGIADYDVDDRGKIWVLNDIGEIWRYNSAADTNGVKVYTATELFENQNKDLLDRPIKMSVCSSEEGEKDLVCLSLISNAGQVAFGLGDYSKLDFKKLSFFDNEVSKLIVGVTSASVATDGKSAFYNIVMEIKNSSGSDYLTFGGILNSEGQPYGLFAQTDESIKLITKVQGQANKAEVVKQPADKSFIPPKPKEQFSASTALMFGFESANRRGFALIKSIYATPFDNDNPEWNSNEQGTMRAWQLVAGYNPRTNSQILAGYNGWGQGVVYNSYRGNPCLYDGGQTSNLEGILKSPNGNLSPFYIQPLCSFGSVGVDGSICLVGDPGRFYVVPRNVGVVTYNGIFLYDGGPVKKIWPTSQTPISIGSKDHIWFYAGENKLSKYIPQTTFPIADFNACWKTIDLELLKNPSIAASSDGGIWFIDRNNNINFRTPDGTIKPVIPENKSAKFKKVSAQGSENDFRMIAISTSDELYSADQSRPLSSEGVFGMYDSYVAINGFLTLSYYPHPLGGWKQIGGRTYCGFIKGNNPNTGKPYEPEEWVYKGDKVKTPLPKPTFSTFIDPSEILQRVFSAEELAPSYQQAKSKQFTELKVATQWGPSPANGRKVIVATDSANNVAIGIEHGVKYAAHNIIYYLNPDLSVRQVHVFNSNKDFDIGFFDQGSNKVFSPSIGLDEKTIKTNGQNLSEIPDAAYTTASGTSPSDVWVANKAFNVFKYSESEKKWKKMEIGASYISSSSDGGLWFIDQTPGEKGFVKYRKPDGTVVDVPGGRETTFAKISAKGSSDKFKIVAIDKDGNLFSGDESNRLTREGIGNVKYAGVGLNGQCVIAFPTNQANGDQSFNGSGAIYIGKIQWAR